MRNKPRIRFKGFTEDWEQRELSSLTEYIGTGKSRFVINEFGEYAILGSTNVIGYDDAYDYDGNFILTARVGANAGQLYRYSGKVKITDNTVFLMSDRSQFIYYTLTHFDLRRLSFGTGQPLVKSSELQKLKLCVSVSKSEQEKIGEIFNNIDNIITLHQRKLEKLKLAKKALLQKLFPKNGSQFPEIRFKGFTDAWEQCKFCDVMRFINGRAYKQDELLGAGKYKVLRVGNFYTNDSWYYSNLELDDKYYAMNGDLLYTWSATFGPHIWKGEKVIYHYHIWKIVLQNNIDKLFALQLLEVDKANIMSDKNGSTMVHITKQGMEKKQTIIPMNLNEQKQIAKFLSSMDKVITLHQCKLDKLQDVKKGLLQKMFV